MHAEPGNHAHPCKQIHGACCSYAVEEQCSAELAPNSAIQPLYPPSTIGPRSFVCNDAEGREDTGRVFTDRVHLVLNQKE